MKKRPAFIAMTCLALTTLLSSAFEVEMDIRPGAIRAGEKATISISVYGASNPPRPQLNSFPGLQIIGTRTESNFSFGSGQANKMTRFAYEVTSNLANTYTIGPFDYTVNNQTKRIAAKQLVVTPSAARQPAQQQEDLSNYLFATVTASSTNVYSQQIFELTLALYYRNVSLAGDIGLINLPESGISFNQFDEIANKRERANGQVYTVRRFRTTARALTTGDFMIQPTLRTQLIVRRQNRQNRFNSLFDMMRQETKPQDVKTKPLTIHVKPTPKKGQPDNFKGAVGQFNFKAQVSPTEITAGDPVTLKIQISGQGNMDTIRPPKGPENNELRTYEAKLTLNELNASETGGRKIWEQVFIPKSDAIKELPQLEFSFFDVQRGAYRTIKQGPFPLNVQPAPQAEQRMLTTSTTQNTPTSRTILGDDLLYLKPLPKKWLTKNNPPWYRNPTLWASQTLAPLLALIGILLARRRNALQSDSALARRVQAPKKARAGLQSAQQALDKKHTSQFFDALWQTLCDYYGNRFNLQAGEISADKIISAIQPLGATEALINNIKTLVTQAESHRYTGQGDLSSNDLHDLYAQLERAVKDSEKL